MRVTQQDIARIARVSQATVSRVLAGDGRVEEEIRGRVLAAMTEHNYKPDVRARSLRQQRTNLIGLVVKREPKDLEGDPFFSMFLSEVLGYLSGTPYHLCVDVAASATRQEHVYDELLRTHRVDGLILVESEPSDERIRLLQNDDFPFVLIGNPHGLADTLYSVDNNNVLAGEIATRHLIEQGFQKIGFLGGPKELTVSRDRQQGYANALCEVDQEMRVWNSEFGYASARDAARKALTSHDQPDALVVLDDFMAMGVIQAARELRLRIPEQLGIVSFNDTNLCHLLDVGLTSVSLNIHEVVRIACDQLMEILDGNGHDGDRRTLVPCEIMVRGSSLRQSGAGDG